MTVLSAAPVSRPVDARSFRPSLGRLVLVEVRKCVDTRAGSWLMAAVVAAAVVVVGAALLNADPADRSFAGFLSTGALPIGLLLPVLGILLVTSEWSQRTVLTTFSLVPHRGRVVVAKLLAGVILGIAAALVCVGITAGGDVVAQVSGETDGSWTTSLSALGSLAVFQLVNVVVGVGFGLALLSSPVAIVLYFALPTLVGILATLVPDVGTVAARIDLSRTLPPLLESAMTGREWAQMAVSTALWAVAPALLAAWWIHRSDIS